MKENSVEEDIILLKDFTEGNFKRDKLENYKGSYKMGYFYYKDIQQALEHILSDYKRVLKENEELNKKIKEQKECAFREDGTEECLWCCSNCHDEWLFYEGTPEENNLKYCPHCGARIREIIKLEEEDE